MIISGSIVNTRQVALTGVDFEFSFDKQSLFVLGTLKTYKYGSAETDCFIIRSQLRSPNANPIEGKLSGAYLGNAFASEKCLSISTNRYDQ